MGLPLRSACPKTASEGIAAKKLKTRKNPEILRLLRFFAAISSLLSLAARTSFSETIYEADSAVLASGARTQRCSYCSSGKIIKDLGGDKAGTATFNNVTVLRDGLYPMTVRYDVGDDRSLLITANGTMSYDSIFYRNARRREISSRALLIPLHAGTNTISFGNDHENGPDLESIRIEEVPVESIAISGQVEGPRGEPLAGVEVRLFGQLQGKTLTDTQGRYLFPFLPKGVYYVRPVKTGTAFAPTEGYCPGMSTKAAERSFKARDFVVTPHNASVLQRGRCRIEYDLNRGLADILFDGKLVIARAFALARLPETLTSMDYKTRKLSQQPINDAFGRGTEYVVESANSAKDKMTQRFWLYDNTDYFLADVEICHGEKAACGYIAPLVSQTSATFLPHDRSRVRGDSSLGARTVVSARSNDTVRADEDVRAPAPSEAGDNRALFVPFDNDKWIRYAAVPFGTEVTSYEVSALYENDSREGLVLGSIEHDAWKTGIKSATLSNAILSLEIAGGVTSSKTRDVLPHGKITGATVRSPKVFIGWFSDWRDGLEAYARANATVAPVRPWKGGVPFGWNSWGKLQQKLTFEKAIEVSDFFAKELQPNHFENNGVVYIGLDSGWNRFSDDELTSFVDHCKSNNQQAGIYFTPFALWRTNDDSPVPGTNFKYKDVFLYANGQKQSLDGGTALDPTHPGTKQLIEATLKRFKTAGFAYVKADFLTHGALEADKFYDPQVTTGMQAYNQGMKFVSQTMGNGMYLNLSISPLFPSQYANSRRIACDTFGDISKIEYTLNSLTYGWWLSGVYDFNDADHVVLDGYTEGENRARVTSSVITGIFISGDDFSASGSDAGKERARRFLTDPEINDVARIRKSFRPIKGNTANRAANLFCYADRDYYYLAAFNYANTNVTLTVDLSRAGLKTPDAVSAKELWSKLTANVSSPMTIHIGPADAALYKFPNH